MGFFSRSRVFIQDLGVKVMVEELSLAARNEIYFHQSIGLLDPTLNAKPDDVEIIPRKGQENYQIIGNENYHFDDREIALEALESLKDIKLLQ